MENGKHKHTFQIYHVFCLLVAIALTSWCIYEYSMDRDVTEIKLRNFHDTKEDILPSITLCVLNPFWEEKYRSYIKDHVTFNVSNDKQADEVISDYKMLLGGQTAWQYDIENRFRYEKDSSTSTKQLIERLHYIDYDSSTISLKDLVSEFRISVPINSDKLASIEFDVLNDTHIIANNKSNDIQDYSLQDMKIINTYTSARQAYYKCFTIDTPLQLHTDIREVYVKLDTSIFSYGLSLSQFYFALTYPNQFIRTPIGKRILIPRKAGKPQCYRFEIHLGSMKVFQRRNKAKSPCNHDWLNHDTKQMNEIIRRVGCNPTHWKKQGSNFPNCSRPNQYSEINKQVYKRNGFMPPCRSIEKLAKTSIGYDYGISCLANSYLVLKLYLDEEVFYEEVRLVAAYDFQSLVGNAGKKW